MNKELNKWMIYVQPNRDELLTSWLVRNSRAQLTKVHTFCSSNWPALEVWNRDVDRFPNPLMLSMLAYYTDTKFKVVYETTLKSYTGKLFESDAVTHSNYILPTGIWHRKRKLKGLLFCPKCLASDGEQPYYRKVWRLSMSFVCSKCKVELLDSCPKCHSPIAFFRNDFISKSDIPRSNLNNCSSCGFNLTMAKSNIAKKNEVEAQLLLEQYLVVGRLKDNPPKFYDVVLHLIWTLTSRNKRLTRFQIRVNNTNPIFKKYRKKMPKKKLNLFSLYNFKERKILFNISIWLLADFPYRLLKLMLETNTTSKAILGEDKKLPFWFKNGVKL
ncbi:MAG: TniQ family protein [Cyclobacteriaceae bacterium]|jgi:hypothetical protein|nr:TniQ family protein [Cyclobacteriaceae bacterium]